MKRSNTTPKIEAIERAGLVLNCFLGSEPLLGLADISASTGFHKSTVLRICVTLCDLGMLSRNDEGLYSVGPLIGQLSNKSSHGISRAMALPVLEKLHDKTGETAALYILSGKRQVCIFRVESKALIRAAIHEGDSLPWNAGASGQVWQAFSDATNFAGDSILEKGYTVSVGEIVTGATAYAAPVFRPENELEAVMVLVGPSQRMASLNKQEIVKELLCSAGSLSASIAE